MKTETTLRENLVYWEKLKKAIERPVWNPLRWWGRIRLRIEAEQAIRDHKWMLDELEGYS